MAGGADVQSLELLEKYLERTQGFRIQLLKELEALHLELGRITRWIESEAIDYWTYELKKAEHRLTSSEMVLSRCLAHVRASEKRPCTEEKKQVDRAKRRKELCQQKLRTARQAAVAWEKVVMESQAKISRCQDLGESELVVACNHLDSLIGKLREYTQVHGRDRPSS